MHLFQHFHVFLFLNIVEDVAFLFEQTLLELSMGKTELEFCAEI